MGDAHGCDLKAARAHAALSACQEGRSRESLKIATFAAISAAALAGTVAMAGPATADPNHTYSWGNYGTGNYAGAGSDTIQDVMNRIASTVHSSAATGSKTLESWDAVNPNRAPRTTRLPPRATRTSRSPARTARVTV